MVVGMNTDCINADNARKRVGPMRRLRQGLAAAVLALGVMLGAVPDAAAWSVVQVEEGVVDPGDVVGYRLNGVRRGDRIVANLHGITGDLSPVLGLVKLPFDTPGFLSALKKAGDEAAAANRDLRPALEKVAGAAFIAWNVDDDVSYDGALSVQIPDNGDYALVVAGAPVPGSGGAGAEPSFGRFRLVLALNPWTPLTQDTQPVGEPFATFSAEVSPPEHRVQTISGETAATRPRAILSLNNFDAGDTLFVRVEGTGGNKAPMVQLLDYGPKVLATSGPAEDGKAALLRYSFKQAAPDYRLRVAGDAASFGTYRLILGGNAPNVAVGGDLPDHGQPVARQPTPVAISIQLDQISDISQRDGKFGVVATMRMHWRDPAYAFNPASCRCSFKTLDENAFRHFLEERNARWPEFVFYNLQGRRLNQGELVFIESNGTAHYMERFAANFQAPDLDFRQFPFDSQRFHIIVDSIYASERYKFTISPTKNGMGNDLGVDEWVISGFETKVTQTDDLKSRFVFDVSAKRHVRYYLLKIFMPLIIILMTSWATFLLKDYNKRIDVTGAHLLLFVAFNFTIANELPRLGYTTFMDSILASSFVVGALLIMLNVWLKREEAAGRLAETKVINRVLLALYPIGYFTPWLVAALVFGISF